jgi:hypothetical protein
LNLACIVHITANRLSKESVISLLKNNLVESLPLGVTNMILLLLGASGGLKQGAGCLITWKMKLFQYYLLTLDDLELNSLVLK